MTMSPGLHKFMLTVHIAVAVGWIGGVVAYLALVVAGMTSQNDQTLRAAWIGLAGSFAIVPLALASLLTGLIISLGTKWGLLRHYWVLFSFLLSIPATIILLQEMQTVSMFANIAAETNSADVGMLRNAIPNALTNPAVGLLVLLLIQVLNVNKPRALTPYGWRKQLEPRTVSQPSNAHRIGQETK
jgi:hypothetical protein